MNDEAESRRDQEIEWFHSFSEQPAAAIAEQAKEANRERVAAFVASNLPDFSLPLKLSAEQFAEAVRELRENKSQWNRSLMGALIRADDLVASLGACAAAASLESFAASCPWMLYAEVARNQAAQYRSIEGQA
jgi:hypothetical protein